MNISISLTKSEMMAVKSIARIFDEGKSANFKHMLIKEITDNTSTHIVSSEDGSYCYDFVASEMLTIEIAGWIRDILSNCKALIFGIADTYKNIVKSYLGNKKLFIDGEEVSICKTVRARAIVENMEIHVVAHVPEDQNDKAVKKAIVDKIQSALKQETAAE